MSRVFARPVPQDSRGVDARVDLARAAFALDLEYELLQIGALDIAHKVRSELWDQPQPEVRLQRP
jgi:hypothetical protein